MSSYNPRVIAHKLDDLQAELTRWSGVARDTLEHAAYTQRQSKESVERVMQQAAIVLDQAKRDEEDVQQARSTVESVLAQSLEAQDVSQQTLDAAQEMLQLANQTLEFWKAELAKALAWLRRAEARLAEAIRQYEQARRALAAAQSRLDSAKSAYNRCRRDPDRRNCNREAAAVHIAQVAVQEASVVVQVAEQEVRAAQLEVEQAKARVACCQRAVGFAQQAASLAQESKSHAVDAVNSAERSLEFAHSAEKTSQVAEEKAIAEMETAENMMSTARRARTLNDDAFMRLRVSDNAEDSAQRYVSIARQEIGHRMQLLHQLNRPSSNSTGRVSRSTRVASQGEKIHFHHIYPAFRGNEEYSNFFESIGIDIDKWTVAVDETTHLRYIHAKSKWNDIWKGWIDEHRGEVTKEEVLQFGRRLLTYFGLEGLWEGGANPNPSYQVSDNEIVHKPPSVGLE